MYAVVYLNHRVTLLIFLDVFTPFGVATFVRCQNENNSRITTGNILFHRNDFLVLGNKTTHSKMDILFSAIKNTKDFFSWGKYFQKLQKILIKYVKKKNM